MMTDAMVLSNTLDVVSVRQAAQVLGVSEKTIYRLASTGKLRAARIGSRVVITKKALLELLGEC